MSGIDVKGCPPAEILTLHFCNLTSIAVKPKVIIELVWLNKSAGLFRLMVPGGVASTIKLLLLVKFKYSLPSLVVAL